jgi:hypothetical protein
VKDITVACLRIHPVWPFGRPGSRTCSQVAVLPSTGSTVLTPVIGRLALINGNERDFALGQE